MTSVPIRVAHRGAGTRYASTNRPTMRTIGARVTVALIFLALVVFAMVGADGGSAIANQCGAVMAGTDAVPDDIRTICQSFTK